ncbi:hypothetical protein BpHYR1_044870 [Brachionus plicatilis]|uniref:Uncharacterized protein n=1 Tax=Brachionus plicatilis TaxID=10195 RepID=A0A3M7R243_BRAPC|nr:hypothetical protein BpHYR1_044870 [Brachionus plicatilis]
MKELVVSDQSLKDFFHHLIHLLLGLLKVAFLRLLLDHFLLPEKNRRALLRFALYDLEHLEFTSLNHPKQVDQGLIICNDALVFLAFYFNNHNKKFNVVRGGALVKGFGYYKKYKKSHKKRKAQEFGIGALKK